MCNRGGPAVRYNMYLYTRAAKTLLSLFVSCTCKCRRFIFCFLSSFFSLQTGIYVIIYNIVYNVYIHNIYIGGYIIIHESFRVPELISCCRQTHTAAVERPVIIKHADRVHWLKRGNTNQPPASPPGLPLSATLPSVCMQTK